MMSAMRVLVTGATGFLGSHLARQLVERGDEVRVLVRASSDRSRLEGLDLTEAIGDVTDEASVVGAVEGVDRVFHCAAAVEFGPRDPSFLERVNVGGARHVLGAAAERSIPAVHVSSLAALGATPAGEPPKDESWWSGAPPAAVYEATKRSAHEYARSLVRAGAPLRIAMPGGIYGYGDESTMASLIKAYALFPVPMGYLPDVRQSLVNVDDCADALLRIADHGVDGGEYIVAAEAVTLREWIDLIATSAGHRTPAVWMPTRWVRACSRPGGAVASWFGASKGMVPETIAVATHDSAYTGDKLRRELGWSPRPLTQGMLEMVGAIQESADRERRERRRARAAQRSTRL